MLAGLQAALGGAGWCGAGAALPAAAALLPRVRASGAQPQQPLAAQQLPVLVSHQQLALFASKAAGAAKKAAGKAAAAGGAKPPRILSAYIYFIKEQSAQRKGTAQAKDLMRELAAEWRSMGEAQRAPYVELAARNKAATLQERDAAKRPKGPPTAWTQWAREVMADMAGSGLRPPQIMQEASVRWKALPEHERQRRKDEASAAREAWKQQQQ